MGARRRHRAAGSGRACAAAARGDRRGRGAGGARGADAALDRLGRLRREGVSRVHPRPDVPRRARGGRASPSRARHAAAVSDGLALGHRGRGRCSRSRAASGGATSAPARRPRSSPCRPGSTTRSTTGTGSRSWPGWRCRCCCARRSPQRPAILRALALAPGPRDRRGDLPHLVARRRGGGRRRRARLLRAHLAPARARSWRPRSRAPARSPRSRCCWPATTS